jgi:4-hydroxy-3-methylbut-2-enyl diphosphate reductase
MNRSLLSQRFRAALDLGPGGLAVAVGFEHPDRGPVRCPAAALLAAELADAGHPVALRPVPVAPDATRLAESDVALFAACYLDPHGGTVGFAVAARCDEPAALTAARRTVADWAAVLRTRQVLIAQTGTVDDCTHPDQALETARGYARRGDTVVVVGRSGDPAAAELLGQIPGPALVAESAADVGTLSVADPQRVAYVLQPGLPVEDAAPVVEALRARFGRLPGQHPSQYCYAASDRRAALAATSQSSDLLLVLGERDDPEAARLLAWSGGRPGERYLIDDARQISRHPLRGAAAVALAPSPAARPELLDETVAALSGLGPMAVVRRTVTTFPDVRYADSALLGRSATQRAHSVTARV